MNNSEKSAERRLAKCLAAERRPATFSSHIPLHAAGFFQQVNKIEQIIIYIITAVDDDLMPENLRPQRDKNDAGHLPAQIAGQESDSPAGAHHLQQRRGVVGLTDHVRRKSAS